ncbi:hypothetical protein VULLAG_LOCUS23175 [Vulpes lagopus]
MVEELGSKEKVGRDFSRRFENRITKKKEILTCCTLIPRLFCITIFNHELEICFSKCIPWTPHFRLTGDLTKSQVPGPKTHQTQSEFLISTIETQESVL